MGREGPARRRSEVRHGVERGGGKRGVGLGRPDARTAEVWKEGGELELVVSPCARPESWGWRICVSIYLCTYTCIYVYECAYIHIYTHILISSRNPSWVEAAGEKTIAQRVAASEAPFQCVIKGKVIYGCFYKSRVLFVDVLMIRALLFGVYSGAH